MASLLTWAGLALAANVEVIAPRPLTPGLSETVWIAVTDDVGQPLTGAPTVRGTEGTDLYVGAGVDGIWPLTIHAPVDDPSPIRFSVFAMDTELQAEVAVSDRSPVPLLVQDPIDGVTWDQQVRFKVSAADLPPPDALSVAVGEGRVVDIERAGENLEVTVELEESRFARVIPVGLLDIRRDAPPVWTSIRLRTRRNLPIETEPNATVNIRVGRRDYGPFEADVNGTVGDAAVDVYPGETLAHVQIVDDLGNQSHGSIPLPGAGRDTLVAFPAAVYVPGRPVPPTYLRAIRGDGSPWVGATPECRVASEGGLPIRKLGPGTWVVTPPGEPAKRGDRLRCQIGVDVERAVALPVSTRVPAVLRMRVWPEELSSEFPAANVRAVAEDGRGERIPAKGIEITADHGRVSLEATEGLVARGEYDGTAAVEIGGDVLRAAYRLESGEGPVAFIDVSHGPVGRSGVIEVRGRALDQLGRPLGGVELYLAADEHVVLQETGTDGWAVAELPLGVGEAPVMLEASNAYRRAQKPVLRLSGQGNGPGNPDLTSERHLIIASGPGVFLHVDPPVLFTGTGAVAFVRVRLQNRQPSAADAAALRLEASEGLLGPVRLQEDGVLVAEYIPANSDRSRVVTITATAEGAQPYSTNLILEPRPVDRATGVSVGGITNLGAITAPMLSLDTDVRTPLFAHTLMVRVSASTWADVASVDTGVGNTATVNTALFTASTGVLWRQERSGRAFWLGAAGVLAAYRQRANFGVDELDITGWGALPPGLQLITGVGGRVGGGEVALELRATGLASPRGAVTYQGQVGGLGAVVGYRLVY